MSTEEMKNIIVEYNVRKLLMLEMGGDKLKDFQMLSRWHEGPVVGDSFPILVDFSSFEDKSLVWKSWKEGFKTPGVFLTKDSRSRREKAGLSVKRKKKTKNDYHAKCLLSCKDIYPSSFGDNPVNCQDQAEKDFYNGDRALLLHGVETDWVEEEMMEDDVDFIRDVLEQKVIKVLQKAGINKKIMFSDVFRWSDGPLHRSMRPVVFVFHQRSDYKLVYNWNPDAWRALGVAVTLDSRSRREGKRPNLSKELSE